MVCNTWTIFVTPGAGSGKLELNKTVLPAAAVPLLKQLRVVVEHTILGAITVVPASAPKLKLLAWLKVTASVSLAIVKKVWADNGKVRSVTSKIKDNRSFIVIPLSGHKVHSKFGREMTVEITG